jgi:hypothetical protein
MSSITTDPGNPDDCQNEEIPEYDPLGDMEELKKYLEKGRLISPKFNGDVCDVPFVTATPAEAAEAAKAAEAIKAVEAAEAVKAVKAVKAAKVNEVDEADEADETDNNPWGRREPPTEKELAKADEDLLRMLVAHKLCSPGTPAIKVREVKFIRVTNEES